MAANAKWLLQPGTIAGQPGLCAFMSNALPLEVLVLEDHPLIRINAADALADCGIMAWEAADAEEASRMLDAHPRIGLIFADVDVPGEMDGLAFATAASHERPGLRVIITSGSTELSQSQIPETGAFLPKPYRAERLVELVQLKLGQEDQARDSRS